MGLAVRYSFNSTKQRGFPGKWLVWPGAAQTEGHYCSTWVILWVFFPPEVLLLQKSAEKAEPNPLPRTVQLICVWCSPRWPSPELLVRMHQTGHQYALTFYGIRIDSAGAGKEQWCLPWEKPHRRLRPSQPRVTHLPPFPTPLLQ